MFIHASLSVAHPSAKINTHVQDLEMRVQRQQAWTVGSVGSYTSSRRRLQSWQWKWLRVSHAQIRYWHGGQWGCHSGYFFVSFTALSYSDSDWTTLECCCMIEGCKTTYALMSLTSRRIIVLCQEMGRSQRVHLCTMFPSQRTGAAVLQWHDNEWQLFTDPLKTKARCQWGFVLSSVTGIMFVMVHRTD